MEDYDTIVNELNVVRRKLESKVQALIILNRELKQCQSERDKLKSLAQHSRHYSCFFGVDEKSLNQTIVNLTDYNKRLKKEVEELKLKVNESRGDVKLLREQIAKQQINISEENETQWSLSQDREELISTLESLKTKYSMLERDFQMVLDEKEELVNERDDYKKKVERLNHQLNHLLKGDDKRIVDIDTLLTENRYLQERLKQIQEEKSLYLQTLSKYKHMLERRRNQGNLKFGAANNGAVIITHKQVQKMLQSTNLSQLPTTQATIADLRSLSLALFESLNDKNTALAHQRKTNKLLGNRLNELENKMKEMEVSLWNDNDHQQAKQSFASDDCGASESPNKDNTLIDCRRNFIDDTDPFAFKSLSSLIDTATPIERLQSCYDTKRDSVGRGSDELSETCSAEIQLDNGDCANKSEDETSQRLVSDDLDEEDNGLVEAMIGGEFTDDVDDAEVNDVYDDGDELPETLSRLVEEALEDLDKTNSRP